MRARILLLPWLVACGPSETEAPPPGPSGWQPGQVLASEGGIRGQLDLRGLIHAHSVYSHDACDGVPRDPDTDAIDAVCFEDFRNGLCTAEHDFVMLSDHGESFERTEYPDVLLYDGARGDELVDRDGGPVASWLSCTDRRALVLAGTETGMMPVGIEAHVAPDPDGRHAVYGATTPEAVTALKDAGAVVLLQHTEDWTVEQIDSLGVDGFEMYNLHANAITGADGALSLLLKLSTPEELPYPDLALLPIWNEDPRYLDTWSAVLAAGIRRVTTIGTDCHRNTFPQLLTDGERIDSYRRMMTWMSNHLLVKGDSGSWDDRALKEALRGGRLYGAFEVMGYPEGFDFHADDGGQVREMGDAAAAGAKLVATMPHVRDLDPTVEPPALRLRILRATASGWELVEEGDTDIEVTAESPGAYRAEVRMQPRHLRKHLSSYADLADADFVWIYANPIYVAP